MRSRSGSGSRVAEQVEEVMHAAGRFSGRSRNGYYRFGGSEGEYLAKEEQRTFQCAVTAIAIAAALVICGCVVWTSADYSHVKAELVAEYNEGVDAWTASHFSAFNATRFEVAYAGQTVPLDAWSEVDPALDSADGTVRDYAPLAFHATSLLELAAVPAMIANGTLPSEGVPSLEDLIAAVGDHSNHDRILPATSPKDAAATMAFLTEPRDVALRVRRADAAPDAPEFEEIALGQFPLATKRSERSNGWKACKYQRFGFYKAGTCVTYSLLDQLCVKVREPEGAEPGTLAWELDSSYGGVGCDPMLHWKPDSWHRVHAPLTGADPSLSSLRLQGRRPGVASTGAVVVRHAKDPMLLARNLTGGTMFFAEEAAGRSAAATVMIVVGLATAVPGLCLVAPFARRALRGEKAFQRSGRTPRRNRGGDQDAFADVL